MEVRAAAPVESTPIRASTRAYGPSANSPAPSARLHSPAMSHHTPEAAASGDSSLAGLIQQISPAQGSRTPSASTTGTTPGTTASATAAATASSPSPAASTPVRTRSRHHAHHTAHASSGHHTHTHTHTHTSGSSSGHHHAHGDAPQKRTSIGPWDFVKSIGAGSMGQVKLAVHRYTRQPAAVKVVPKAMWQRRRGVASSEKESEEAKDARVIREAALGRLIDHPNIAKLYDVYSMTAHYYLVFEYIAGGQMLDYIITHGCVKEQQARRFARSIASALDYLHQNSIVHRDLKIENILIADDGDVRLIDFGLSNMFSRASLLKTFCGSLYFAAPELLNALPYVGPEVDVWSFGVVLYVLVCGKVPFEDKSMTVLHAKIKRGVVEYPSWLSSLCVDLLSRMLVVSPSERATLHEVMHHPWMLKNFDGPVSAHMPRRTPLRLPLDPAVLREMADLKLGTEEQLQSDLEQILSSAEYTEAVAAWESRGSTSSMTLPLRTPDPLDSFHPAISMYFLARERLEKRQTQSSQNVPVVQPVAPTPQTPQTPQQKTPQQGQRMRARTVGTYEAPPSLRQPLEPLPPAPVLAAKGSIRIVGPAEIPAQSKSTPDEVPNTPQTPLLGAPVTQSASPTHPSHSSHHSTTQTEDSGNLGSIFRRLSLRKPSAKRQHMRAKSMGHPLLLEPTADSAETAVASADAMPSIAHPKPVFLRGFLSVQSTSTKPLVQIRSEIIRALEKLDVEYVEIRGGFACVSRSSTLSNSGSLGSDKRGGAGAGAMSLSRQASGVQRRASSHQRTRSSASGHGYLSPTLPMTPMSPLSPGATTGSTTANSTFTSTDSVEMEIGGSDMLGNSDVVHLPTPVRFEIMIVRVPMMGMHGVQFKKMTGNVWQYKTLAQEILAELHL